MIGPPTRNDVGDHAIEPNPEEMDELLRKALKKRK
jgi:hypothetical protein